MKLTIDFSERKTQAIAGAVGAVLITIILVALGGNDGESSNDDKVLSAEATAEGEGEILAMLDEELDLEYYAGVDDTFSPELGGCEPVTPGEEAKPCCDIDGIYQVEELQIYGEESNVLVSPEGDYGVSIGNFQETDPAVCLSYVQETLGW